MHLSNPGALCQTVRTAWHRALLFVIIVGLLTGCGGTAVSDSPTAANSQPLTTVPQLQWQAAFGDGLSAPPVWAGGWVIAATETAVIALNAADGMEQWRYAPAAGVWPRSLAAQADTVLVGVPGAVAALDAATGAERWRQPITGEMLWPPAVAGSQLFVGTAFVGPGVFPNAEGKAWIAAFETATGEPLWSVETAAYTLTTPAADEDTVFVAGSVRSDADVDEGGHLRLHAFDRRSGAVRWIVDRTDGFLKSLAVIEERLIFLAYTDMVYGLETTSGAETWRYPTENWSPGFQAAGDGIYLGSDNGFVHAVEPVQGTAVWRTQLSGVFNAPRARPTVVDEYLYFQGNDNRLYCLERTDGSLVWQSEPQPRSRVAPLLAAGHLFLVGADETLYAYAATADAP